MNLVAPVFSGMVGFLPLALITAGAAAETPTSGEPFKLSDALALAYQSSPRLAEARAAVEALDQGVAQAKAGYRPSVNATFSKGYDHGLISGFPGPVDTRPLVGGVTVSESLFRGGRTDAEVNRALAQVHAGRAELAATEQAVLLAAVTAYMDVVRDLADLKFNRDNVHTLEDELRDVRTELAAGVVTRTDQFQAEARLARARADLTVAEARLSASRAAFENTIGRPPGTLETSVPLPPVADTRDKALETALQENPDLDQAKANERAASYAVDDAIAALMPDVSLQGQYQYLMNAPNASIFTLGNPQQVMSVALQVNVPIYQGGQEEATVRRARDLHEQADLALAATEREVRQNLISAWQALDSSRLAITANQAQADANQGAVNGVKQEQQAGERSVLDILNAQQELFASQVALAAAQHDGVIGAYRLLSTTGQLTARALHLNTTLYDPEEHYGANADAWFGLGK